MTHSTQSDRRALYVDLGVVAAFVAIGVFLQLHFGLGDLGIYHPDEIYQTLEPAHEMVYGFGLHAWEWDIGARNALLPAMLAGVLGLGRLFGLEQPAAYLGLMHGFVASVFSASAFAVYLLARHFRASRPAALAGAALFLFNPVSLYLGYRVLSEVISTPVVLFGVLWTLQFAPADADAHGAAPQKRRARLLFILGVSLLGISVLFRLQNALFVVALLLPWRFHKGGRARYELGMQVLVVWALIFGAIDWITWGLPFASAGAYLRFNLLMDGTTSYYGADSFFYYPYYFSVAMGVAGALLTILPVFSATRARALLVSVGVFLLIHSIFPHKELRFVVTTLPILAALSAVGAQWLVDRAPAPRRRLAAGLGAAALFAAAGYAATQTPNLTFGRLGQTSALQVTPDTPAYGHFAPVNRLLLVATERTDICGLSLPDQWAIDAGGHTYFHRDLPFFHAGNPPPAAGTYNFAISQRPAQPGWRAVHTHAPYTLYKTGDHACAPAPEYQPVIYQPVEDAPTP